MRGKGKLKSIAVMAYCHFSVSLLCLNVLFDLTMFGFPLYMLHIMRILPYALFLRLTTLLIEWTTPIVFAMPLVFSGTKVFCNDLDLLVEAKATSAGLAKVPLYESRLLSIQTYLAANMVMEEESTFDGSKKHRAEKDEYEDVPEIESLRFEERSISER